MAAPTEMAPPEVEFLKTPPLAALIVVDMQRVFGSMMDAPLPYIKKLYDFFEERGWPIFFTQHGHEPEEFVPPIKNQLIRKVGPEDAIKVGSRDWELIPEVWKMAKEYPVVAKNTYDAFERTKLLGLIQETGVEKVIICGVMTEICCETTTRSAFVKDYEAWLVSDACGTDDLKGHERALESCQRLTDNVKTTKQAMMALETEHNIQRKRLWRENAREQLSQLSGELEGCNIESDQAGADLLQAALQHLQQAMQ